MLIPFQVFRAPPRGLGSATFAILLAACGSAEEESAFNDEEGTGTGSTGGGLSSGGSGVGTGGSSEPSFGAGGAIGVGGGTETGGASTGGAVQGAGGISSGGGAPNTLVDCSGITNSGYELCEATATTCTAVFTDSSGCSATCAAAGLTCEGAYENSDAACAADDSLPALPCDSGHQSDFCVCVGPQSGSGGAPATGGADGTGGVGGTGGAVGDPSDCNQRSDLPTIRIAKNGSGDFSTMQSAIDSLPSNNSTLTRLLIAPASYQEKLVVDVPNIILCGQVGQEASTLLTYTDGADTPNDSGGTVGTSGSASVNISASDVSAENLTFENTRGVGSQAVALLISGQRVQFKNSRFIGHQDTLYVKEGSQYFRDSYVEGTVDFIFGGATAVFEDCTIHNVGGGSAVTAPSTDESVPFGIVFLGGQLTAASGVNDGSVNLGRNWRPYGSTSYIRTELGSHITSGGWIPMGDNTLATARFSEFQTTGPGANAGARVPESSQLTAGEAAAFTVDNIFGDWDPTYAD